MKFLFLILLVIALMLTIWLASQLITGLRSLEWPSVVGEIIMKDLEISDTVRKAMRHPDRYVYRYNVRGIDYFCQRVTVSDAFISQQAMVSRVLDRYPDGAMVTVYYQRQNPQAALLERGPRKETVIYLALAVLAVSSSIYGFVSYS